MTVVSLHYVGYEAIEDLVPVEEIHRSQCTLCDWKSEEFDALDWKGAEEAALAHVEELHQATCYECDTVFTGEDVEEELEAHMDTEHPDA